MMRDSLKISLMTIVSKIWFEFKSACWILSLLFNKSSSISISTCAHTVLASYCHVHHLFRFERILLRKMLKRIRNKTIGIINCYHISHFERFNNFVLWRSWLSDCKSFSIQMLLLLLSLLLFCILICSICWIVSLGIPIKLSPKWFKIHIHGKTFLSTRIILKDRHIISIRFSRIWICTIKAFPLPITGNM